MKKYKFYTINSSGKILYASNGYFDDLRTLPKEFTLDEFKKVAPINGTKTLLSRMEKAKSGTILKWTRLCGWSNRSGGSEYLGIMCVGDASSIEKCRIELINVEEKIKKIDNEIYAIAQRLIDEKKALEKVKKSLKESIAAWDDSGEIK